MNFIERAKIVHGDKYDYTNCIYIDSKTKVEITCPYHGNFWQIPNSHLLGHGCPECGGSKRGSKELFIEKAKMCHGDKYDYSKVEYVNNNTKVCIICPEHGEFWQTPHNHLRYGCKECRNQNNRTVNLKTKEDFISKANLVHSNKYDYSNIDYVNRTTKICIICPKHGKFYQKPCDHLSKQGCPICHSSHMETEIREFLIYKKVKFEEQKRFEWLGRQTLDFYLPDYNVAIECQGLQHFEDSNHFGIKNYGKINEMDRIKLLKCKENGIKVLYYANYKYNFPYYVYTDKEILFNNF